MTFPNYPALFRGREELYREIHYVLQQVGISPANITSEWRVRQSEVPVAEPPTIQLALKNQPIFSNLADEEIEQIAMKSQQKQYDAKSVIQYEDGEIDALDVLISGVVQVSTKLAKGKEIVLGELGPGDSYGLVSMFTDQPIPTHWIAETDVTLIRIDYGLMKDLVQKYPDVANLIAVEVKQRQDEAEYLRIQNSAEPPQSSLQEIKRYIRQIIKRRKIGVLVVHPKNVELVTVHDGHFPADGYLAFDYSLFLETIKVNIRERIEAYWEVFTNMSLSNFQLEIYSVHL